MREAELRVGAGRDLVGGVDNVLEAANGPEVADRGAGAGRAARAGVRGSQDLVSPGLEKPGKILGPRSERKRNDEEEPSACMVPKITNINYN